MATKTEITKYIVDNQQAIVAFDNMARAVIEEGKSLDLLTKSISRYVTAVEKSIKATENSEVLRRRQVESRKIGIALNKQVSAGIKKASFDEQAAYRIRLGALKDFVLKSKLSAKELENIDTQLRAGRVNAYTGELGKAQKLLLDLARAEKKFGSEAKAAAEKARKEQEKLNRSVKTTENNTKNLIISWQTFTRLVASQLASRAISATVSSLRDAWQASVDFENKLAAIRTIDKTGAPLQNWRDGLRELSDQFGSGILDQAEAAYQSLSNQITEGTSALIFLAEANKLALTGLATTEDTVKLLSSAINAFGLSMYDTERISAVFFKTVELGRVKIGEMGDAFGRIAVPANQLGVTLEEVSAGIARLTVQGVKYDVASTFLRNVILKLIKPTTAMTEYLNELGFANGQVAVQTLGFAGVLAALDAKTKGAANEIGELFGRIRAITGYMGLSAKGLDKYNKILEEMKDAQSTYAEKIKIVLNSAGKSYEILVNKIANVFKSDVTVPFLNYLSRITEGFTTVDKSIKGALAAVSTFAAALATGTIVTSLVSIAAKLKAVGVAATLASGPFVALAAALAGLAAYFYSTSDAAKTFRDTTVDAITAINEATKVSQTNLTRLLDDFKDSASKYTKIVLKEITEQVRIAYTVNSVARRDLQAALNASAIDAKAQGKIVKAQLDKSKKEYDNYREYIESVQGELATSADARKFGLFDWSTEFLEAEDKVAAIQTEIKKLHNQRIDLLISGDFSGVERLSQRIDELIAKNKELQGEDKASLLTKREYLVLAEKATRQEHKQLEAALTRVNALKKSGLKDSDPSLVAANAKLEAIATQIRERNAAKQIKWNHSLTRGAVRLSGARKKIKDIDEKLEEINKRDGRVAISRSAQLIAAAKTRMAAYSSEAKILEQQAAAFKKIEEFSSGFDADSILKVSTVEALTDAQGGHAKALREVHQALQQAGIESKTFGKANQAYIDAVASKAEELTLKGEQAELGRQLQSQIDAATTAVDKNRKILEQRQAFETAQRLATEGTSEFPSLFKTGTDISQIQKMMSQFISVSEHTTKEARARLFKFFSENLVDPTDLKSIALMEDPIKKLHTQLVLTYTSLLPFGNLPDISTGFLEFRQNVDQLNVLLGQINEVLGKAGEKTIDRTLNIEQQYIQAIERYQSSLIEKGRAPLNIAGLATATGDKTKAGGDIVDSNNTITNSNNTTTLNATLNVPAQKNDPFFNKTFEQGMMRWLKNHGVSVSPVPIN